MRVHHLNCGTMCPVAFDLARVFPPEHAMVCHVLLIETPSSGLVLVDTGFGTLDLKTPGLLGAAFQKLAGPLLREEETAAAQVKRLGFEPSDVRHIVPTHLDLDHAGGLPDFPLAKVHAYEPEVRAMERGATLAERHRYRRHQFAHRPDWVRYEVSGERWRGFECVRSLAGLPPEILLVPTVGHSRGHVAVVVESAAGALVHAGDAYFHHAEIRGDGRGCPLPLRLFQRAAAFDDTARRQNQARLRELARSLDIQIFSAHDPVEAASHGVEIHGRR
jgi:glyoxylase-like metal-dependent hydrolase (beta-lactamase superfamily II)